MALIEVKVPDIGDFKDVAVIELLVKPGDTVRVDQSLVTVESDKASMEIPSSAAGVVKELKVALGDKINEGSLLLVLEAEAGVATPVAAGAPPSATAPGSAAAAATSAVRAELVEAPAASPPAGSGRTETVTAQGVLAGAVAGSASVSTAAAYTGAAGVGGRSGCG